MLYSEEEIKEVESILEKDEACELLDKLDGLLGMELPSVSDMIDDALGLYKANSMCVSRAEFIEEGKVVGTGYVIETERNGEGYSVYRYCKCEDGNIPSSLLITILELTNLGYNLKVYRDMKTLKLNMNGGVWNGSIG